VGGPVVFAVGDTTARGPTVTGVALRSDDGGRSWVEILAAAGGSLGGVHFVDRFSGWITGGGRIYRTDDGGGSFEEQTPNIEIDEVLVQVRDVSAADSLHAMALVRTSAPHLLYDEVVLHTADGGASWRRSEVPEFHLATVFGGRLGRACLAGDGSGLLMGGTQVLLTADAGATWRIGPRFDYSYDGPGWHIGGYGFNDPLVACSGPSDLWIVTGPSDSRRDLLWHSADGGTTWEDLTDQLPATSYQPPHAVGGFLASGAGWLAVPRAGGPTHLVRRRAGGAWIELPSPFAYDPGHSAEYAEAIGFVDERRGAVLTTVFDPDGPIRHRALVTDSGGSRWDEAALPEAFRPLGLSVVR
jgi:photosystem II stability/assembly factor-like uncharacterized protein